MAKEKDNRPQQEKTGILSEESWENLWSVKIKREKEDNSMGGVF